MKIKIINNEMEEWKKKYLRNDANWNDIAATVIAGTVDGTPCAMLSVIAVLAWNSATLDNDNRYVAVKPRFPVRFLLQTYIFLLLQLKTIVFFALQSNLDTNSVDNRNVKVVEREIAQHELAQRQFGKQNRNFLIGQRQWLVWRNVAR